MTKEELSNKLTAFTQTCVRINDTLYWVKAWYADFTLDYLEITTHAFGGESICKTKNPKEILTVLENLAQ